MIQRLPSLNAQLDIVPLEEDGKSDVVIKVDKQKPISFSAGYDNEGSPTYGQRSYNMGVTFDDLAGLYDMLYFNYHTNEHLYKGRYSKTFSALYSVPCGNHLWSVAYSDSRFLTTTQGQVQPIKFEGGMQSLSADWDYVLQRSRTSKTQIGLELNHKRIRNEIQGMRQITGCRNLTTLQVKLSHMTQLFRGWMTATMRFIRGLRCNSLGSATNIPTTFHKFAGDRTAGEYTLSMAFAGVRTVFEGSALWQRNAEHRWKFHRSQVMISVVFSGIIRLKKWVRSADLPAIGA